MKTKIYLIIFLVLSAFAVYTLLQSDAKTDSSKEKAFKIEDFEEVTQIKISDRKGESISLKKEDNNWILNDTYPVREHLFSEMKEALTKMEASSPLAKVGQEAVLKQMIAGALKVEVYKGKKKDKVIYIGGPNLTNTASHMFLEIDGKASNKIYNVSIPGFRGFLTTRFIVDVDEWRSKNIFSYLPSEIKKIDVKFFNLAEQQDFTLTKDGNDYSLTFQDKKYTTPDLDETSIVNYLLSLESQDILDYSFTTVQDVNTKDSLLREKKYAELSITDINNNIHFSTIVDMPLNESSKQQYDAFGDPMKYDVDYKYIIFGENKDWGIITDNKFGAILTDPNNLLKSK